MNQINTFKKTKIIIALDYPDVKSAMQLIFQLDPTIYKLKIGQEMFIRFGKKFIHQLKSLNFDIFLDLKFHDIPSTIFKSVYAASELGVWMISLHACGGIKMMQYAKKAIKNCNQPLPLLVAVTALTSFSINHLQKIGVTVSLKEYILQLSKIIQLSKLDGIICPGVMSNVIKNTIDYSIKTIVPGIRFKNHISHDQKIITTPQNIKKYNINYIVVGRTITQSTNPLKKLNNILNYI
ncbi:Orotidine 5'-phosphate decarboxylase [Buchnera aphidicola (Pterocallis alni)]|uniref:orotidine-5'-phosphate decarboxylase n=1 Tax=Buchnera aphidicola TaxID=9 RepID=UPI003463C152